MRKGIVFFKLNRQSWRTVAPRSTSTTLTSGAGKADRNEEFTRETAELTYWTNKAGVRQKRNHISSSFWIVYKIYWWNPYSCSKIFLCENLQVCTCTQSLKRDRMMHFVARVPTPHISWIIQLQEHFDLIMKDCCWFQLLIFLLGELVT